MEVTPTFPTAAARRAYHKAIGDTNDAPVDQYHILRMRALERTLASKPVKLAPQLALEEFSSDDDVLSLSSHYMDKSEQWGVSIAQLKDWKRRHLISGPRGRVWAPCRKPDGGARVGFGNMPVAPRKPPSNYQRNRREMSALRDQFSASSDPMWLPLLARPVLLDCIKRGSEIGRRAAYEAAGIPTESLLTASITSATMNLIEERFWFAMNKKPRKK